MAAIRLDFNSVDGDGYVIGLVKNLDLDTTSGSLDVIEAYDADGEASMARVVESDDTVVRLELLPGTWHRRRVTNVVYSGDGRWERAHPIGRQIRGASKSNYQLV